MPVDCEMLYAASPPLFMSNSFVDFHFSSFAKSSRRMVPKSLPMRVTLPLRSCLILRDVSPPTSPGEDCNGGVAMGPASPTKNKKRVVFADDRGFSLTHVKIMTEPSNCPPRWHDDFLKQVTKGATATVTGTKWELIFSQPASDYLEFRQKLEAKCLSLENVIIREVDETVSGTIKVKNLSFSKEVIVRTTFDNWITSNDVEATYVPSGCEGTSIHDIYDTFSFEFALPSDAVKCRRIEMCVSYKCEGGEFWDSNDGKNYCIVASSASKQPTLEHQRFDDVVKANFDSWSEFASWNHLVNDCPYW